MMNTINALEDIIDSRDVIERIDELSEDVDSLDDDDRAELTALQHLAEQAGESPDWIYGETLIRESYFTEYAQQLAEDCGMVQHDAPWPNNCIDWAEAARQLRQDYFEVEFDGIIYLIRE